MVEIKGGLMTRKKYLISKKIRDYSDEIIEKDLNNLIELPCNESIQKSLAGNKVIDNATFAERLDVKYKNINFYEILDKKDELIKKAYIKKLYDYEKRKYPNSNEEKIWYDIKRIYYGSVSSFKPSIAKYIYCKYGAKNILDFSAGWGGRLLGALVIPNTKYIGIDTNLDLKEGYNYLINLMNAKDRVKIIWSDSSKVDYSKLNYDFVFTSPPYYSLEKYSYMPIYKNNEEFILKFWKPLIINVWKNLKKKGKMLLNMPDTMYNDTIEIIGKADEFIPLIKANRGDKFKKDEFIYVWFR